MDRLTNLATERCTQREIGMRRECRACRDRAEMSLDGGDDLLFINVANNGEDGIVRCVPGGEEVAHILERGGVEVFHGADGWVMVRVPLRIRERKEFDVGAAVRLVVVAGALLVLHHVALVVEVRLIKSGEECAESIGLHPEDQLRPFCWHGGEVVGAVEPGGGVPLSADRFNQGEVLRLGDVLGALEHEVFKEVRESGAPSAFIFRANVIPDVDGGDRRGAINDEEEAQAIGEPMFANRQRRRRRARRHPRSGWRLEEPGRGARRQRRRRGPVLR